jgi:predicted MFS family arabinose efflux permease
MRFAQRVPPDDTNRAGLLSAQNKEIEKAIQISLIRLRPDGLLLAGPGIHAVLVIDIASYLLSAALIAAVSRRIVVPPASPTRARPLDDLKAGFRYVAKSPTLRGLLSGNEVFLTANAGLTALLVPLAVERLDAPGYAVGYLISGLGAGTLLGASVSAKALTWLGIRNLASITQLATSLAFFALVNAPGLTAAVGAAVLIGIPGSLLMISVETTVQRTSPQEFLGRIGALFFAMDSLALIVGALGAPALVALLGLGPALNLLSAFALVAAPVTLLAVPRRRPPPGVHFGISAT